MTLEEQIQRIKEAGLIQQERDLPKFEDIFMSLEQSADRMMALMQSVKKERSAALATQIHTLIGDLARTYEDEKVVK